VATEVLTADVVAEPGAGGAAFDAVVAAAGAGAVGEGAGVVAAIAERQIRLSGNDIQRFFM